MAKSSPVYKQLRDRWINKHRELQEALWAKHGDVIQDFINGTKNFAIGSISGLMLLSSPAAALIGPTNALTVKEEKLPIDPDSIGVEKNVFLISDLSSVVPREVRPLSSDEEKEVERILSRDFGFKVVPSLSGKRLNRSYGYIGAEQHLARYPGDNMITHFDPSSLNSSGQAGSNNIPVYSSGMAPGLGAWGYFAPSRDQMTEQDKLREKYYIATQTFLAPGFADNVREYITFFKFRKMLVVNPQNGRAMVVIIGDAGPAEWTGKHLGGSPEVMKYLERVDGAQRGPVLYFFIDDPDDKIPLGPVEIK